MHRANTRRERCIAMSCVMTAASRECAQWACTEHREPAFLSRSCRTLHPGVVHWLRKACSCEAPDAPLRRNCNGEAQSRGVMRACGEMFSISLVGCAWFRSSCLLPRSCRRALILVTTSSRNSSPSSLVTPSARRCLVGKHDSPHLSSTPLAKRSYNENIVLSSVFSASLDEQSWIKALAACKHPTQWKRFMPPIGLDKWSMDITNFFRASRQALAPASYVENRVRLEDKVMSRVLTKSSLWTAVMSYMF